MSDLRFTLLSDGSSDQVLMPVLVWLLRRHGVNRPVQPVWADLRRLPRPPVELPDRISVTLALYPCDLLFVHRDAEGMSHESRKAEILAALDKQAGSSLPAVCVIPVRMQEAWLLFDKPALRRAAGNPNSQQPLPMPRLEDLELLPDPKAILYELLREASGLQGRRRKKFHVQTGARRVVESIESFSPLLRLRAFEILDRDVRETIQAQGWGEDV
jgi:hypothetical protein